MISGEFICHSGVLISTCSASPRAYLSVLFGVHIMENHEEIAFECVPVFGSADPAVIHYRSEYPA